MRPMPFLGRFRRQGAPVGFDHLHEVGLVARPVPLSVPGVHAGGRQWGQPIEIGQGVALRGLGQDLHGAAIFVIDGARRTQDPGQVAQGIQGPAVRLASLTERIRKLLEQMGHGEAISVRVEPERRSNSQ